MLALRPSRNPRGLTLVELICVVAILAMLAGLIVPRIGIARNLAARAANADQTRECFNQAIYYNLVQNKYPQGEDTLLNAAGTVYSKLDPSLAGVLTPVTLDVNAAKSINQFATFDTTGNTAVYLFNNDETFTGNAGDSGKLNTTVTVGGGSLLAQIKVPVGTDVTGNKLNYQIYLGLYGSDKLDATTGAPLDGTYLVALGVGPNSEFNNKSMLTVPSLWTKDPAAYNRAILLMKVFPTATLASYTGVSGVTYTGPAKGTSAGNACGLSPEGLLVQGSLDKYTQEKAR